MFCPRCDFDPASLDLFRILELSPDFPERTRFQRDPEHRMTLEFYAWYVGGFDNGKVLDVGAGPGTVAVPLARLKNVSEVLCFDRDDSALQELERIGQIEGINNIRTTNEGQPWALPFSDASFDIVVCRYSMHHFADQPGTMSEMGRCLRPGGVLLYSDPAMPRHSRDTTHGLYLVREDSFHGYRTYHEMIELVRGAGLDVMGVRPYDYQRGTLDDFLKLTDPALKEPLIRAWLGLDEQTKAELKWTGAREGPFITYPIIDIAARKQADA